jgi:hypothetical protein
MFLQKFWLTQAALTQFGLDVFTIAVFDMLTRYFTHSSYVLRDDGDLAIVDLMLFLNWFHLTKLVTGCLKTFLCQDTLCTYTRLYNALQENIESAEDINKDQIISLIAFAPNKTYNVLIMCIYLTELYIIWLQHNINVNRSFSIHAFFVHTLM